MSPIQSITTCLRKSFQFSGRASRSEVWPFSIFTIVVGVALLWVAAHVGLRITTGRILILILILMVPYFSALVRRMHDLDFRAWSATVPFAFPFVVGLLVLMITFKSDDGFLAVGWMVLATYATPILFAIAMGVPGTPGSNYYGPNPLEVTP